MKENVTHFFSKCGKSTVNCGFATFTEEILNGKLPFLCRVRTRNLEFEDMIKLLTKRNFLNLG